jgi:hypothetical protein
LQVDDLVAKVNELVEEMTHMQSDHLDNVASLQAGWLEERNEILERLQISEHEVVKARCSSLLPPLHSTPISTGWLEAVYILLP